MERINLTPKTVYILPVEYNGENIDLSVDTEDLSFQTNLPKMADIISTLGEEYKKEKDVSKLDEMKNKACNELYNLFCEILPKFAEITENKPITQLSVWLAIISYITDMKKQTALDKTVISEIEEEEKTTI